MSAGIDLRTVSLDDALAKVKEQIRKDASNTKNRIFLFQMLTVLGQWDKALNQLEALAGLDPESLDMVTMYRTVLECEALRSEVFRGNRTPLIFGEPDHWLALLLQALNHAARGEFAQAAVLRSEAMDEAPATAGTIDGEPFEWIADADSRLGPVVEAVVNGRYYWVPMHRIQRIDLEAPEDLRDVVWMPARFVWANGGELVGLIPTRYPGSESVADDAIRLSRKTEWQDLGEGCFAGLGQRMLVTDSGEYALMDVRHIEFNAATREASDSTEP